jgi:hypothetical protein
MSGLLHFIRDLLRLETPEVTERNLHEHERGEPFDRRRPLYIGRGLICLGTEPVKSRYRGSRD